LAIVVIVIHQDNEGVLPGGRNKSFTGFLETLFRTLCHDDPEAIFLAFNISLKPNWHGRTCPHRR
jgi:hypothetical protein